MWHDLLVGLGPWQATQMTISIITLRTFMFSLSSQISKHSANIN